MLITKVPDQNQLQIQLSLSPSDLELWNDVNFTDIVQIEPLFPNSTKQPFTYNVVKNPNGTVTITVDYNEDLQNNALNITINPAYSGKNGFSRTPPMSTTITVIPDDNQGAFCYPNEAYKLRGVTSTVANALAMASLGVFVIGLVSGKMIGIEMMAVVQISFFSLITLS
jgi:hypothetical protein